MKEWKHGSVNHAVNMKWNSNENNSPFGEWVIVILLFAMLQFYSAPSASGKYFSDASSLFHDLHQYA